MPDDLFANLGRVLSNDGDVIGSGVALQGGWFLTCAHVVAHALLDDPKAYGADAPTGTISFDVGGGSERTCYRATLDGCIWGPQREEANHRGGGDYALLPIMHDELPQGLMVIADPPVEADPALYAWGFPKLDPENGFQADLELTNRGWAHDARDLVTVKPAPNARDGFIHPGYSGGPVMSGRFPSIVLGIVKSTDIERKERIELAHIVPARTLFRAHSDAFGSMRKSVRVSVSDTAVGDGISQTSKEQTSEPRYDFPSHSRSMIEPVTCAEKAEARSYEAEVRRLSAAPTSDLRTAISEFLTELEAKKNQIPEPFSEGFIARRAERLDRMAERIHMLEAASIGEFAYHLLGFSTALCGAPGTQREDFGDLTSAVDQLVGALQPGPGHTSRAQAMASDGPWPPGVRLGVRKACSEVIDNLEPLHGSPEHERLATNAEASVGSIEDQTWLEKPAWAVMAQNALDARKSLASLADGPFADLLDSGAELRHLLLSTQQRVVAALPHGAVFRDLPTSPEMVVVPACPGGFLMGSPEDQEGHYENEKWHRVTMPQKFALGRYALTFDEYDVFCDATGREKPADEDWGRGRRPAINVSWEEAQVWCAWMVEQTGAEYRLPSEAEWEYACRGDAGGENETHFCPAVARTGNGAYITVEEANFDGNYIFDGSPKGEYREKTVPVDHAAFNPNRFGLWQMHGNVSEWCADVFEEDYDKTPLSGSAHLPQPLPEGHRRVLRGGSWSYSPRDLRSASRGRIGPDYRSRFIGFRPARTLLTP